MIICVTACCFSLMITFSQPGVVLITMGNRMHNYWNVITGQSINPQSIILRLELELWVKLIIAHLANLKQESFVLQNSDG